MRYTEATELNLYPQCSERQEEHIDFGEDNDREESGVGKGKGADIREDVQRKGSVNIGEDVEDVEMEERVDIGEDIEMEDSLILSVNEDDMKF